MEQLRQLGEVVGSINALMAFEPELRVNPRQCRLLADVCAHALAAVTAEVRAHLRFEERGAKWRAIEAPLRELHRAFRDAEGYVRQCLDPRGGGGGGDGGWWARAAAMAHGTECVEQHLHAILWCVAVAIEAVEAAAEIAGSDAEEIARRRLVLAKKYDRDMVEPRMFQNAYGKMYLVPQELVTRMDMAWKEDRWLLSQLLDGMKSPAAPKPLMKSEQRLADVLTAPRGKLHPASILLSGDYSVRRRLGGRLKEAQWMGESFAVKHFIGDAEAEVGMLSLVSHPNVAHAAYCFRDEERKEYFVVMDQLMAKDLGSYVKEVSCPRRRIPFPLVVAVDIMLQIARGMEYLHANKIYHGELNPSNVLVKPRQPEAYVHVKVAGFERSGTVTSGAKASANGNANANANGGGDITCIWYAPEVLLKESGDHAARRTEKADVYSFGMICFELLTGKVPFEDNHLQGDKTSKNIRAGERPLFPFQAPKYLVSLTKRCWHADPAQRPQFASVCRVLRYVKRFLVMNPDQQQGQADAPPAAPATDYLDIEAQLLRRVPAWQRGEGTAARVADVPFQMFAYRAVEREKTSGTHAGRDRSSDSGSEGNSLCGEENGVGATTPDNASTVSGGTVRSRPESSEGKKTLVRKAADGKAPPRQTGSQQKVKPASAVKPPATARKTPGEKPEVPARRPTSGHGSD
ncbi:Light-sensor Protein kinase [Dichanthelium oligosanthes]|uniref:Light-sensor Protein kinase n=1 Tax=Dichanthelium oligosanthes TaxID=888268 RepID=A0A1E5V8S4_9POAL|nr:Light-sensor Protein kinase [Dichanthelium oligosanthes]